MYLVRAGLPPDARRLAAERGYLPDGVPLVKRIAALEGDRVCALDDAVSVNGRVAAKRQARDRLGRPLPRWTGCHVLADDELFLLMADVRSEEHTSELQSLMRISYAVFCLKKKKYNITTHITK